MKSLAMSAKHAAQILSKISGTLVVASELKEIFPDFDSSQYTPLHIREAHAKIQPGRAKMLSAGKGIRTGVAPLVLVCHFTKGGVGKTTVLSNLAVEWAKMGSRILFIDADPQGTATTLYGIDPDDLSIRTIMHVIFGHEGTPVSLEEAVIPLYEDAVLDLIPSDIQLNTFDGSAFPRRKREHLISDLLEKNKDFLSQYDMIIVDTNPGSNLFNLNFMVASDAVIMPISLDVLSVKSMRLMASELQEVSEVEPRDRNLMVVGNIYEANTRHGSESFLALKESYGSSFLNAVIPAYAGASRQGWTDKKGGQLLVEQEPNSAAALKMGELSVEILNRIFWPDSASSDTSDNEALDGISPQNVANV